MYILLSNLVFVGNCFNANDYISILFLKFPDSLTYNVLEISSIFEYCMATIYIGCDMHNIDFFIMQSTQGQVGYWYTHPAPKTPERIQHLQFEKFSLDSPYSGYYETRDFGIKEFLISLVIYMVTFDIWFYTSHVIGHMPIFWKHFKGEHNEFVCLGCSASS